MVLASLGMQMPYQPLFLSTSDCNSLWHRMLRTWRAAEDVAAIILAGPKWQARCGSEKRANVVASTRR